MSKFLLSIFFSIKTFFFLFDLIYCQFFLFNFLLNEYIWPIIVSKLDEIKSDDDDDDDNLSKKRIHTENNKITAVLHIQIKLEITKNWSKLCKRKVRVLSHECNL